MIDEPLPDARAKMAWTAGSFRMNSTSMNSLPMKMLQGAYSEHAFQNMAGAVGSRTKPGHEITAWTATQAVFRCPSNPASSALIFAGFLRVVDDDPAHRQFF